MCAGFITNGFACTCEQSCWAVGLLHATYTERKVTERKKNRCTDHENHQNSLLSVPAACIFFTQRIRSLKFYLISMQLFSYLLVIDRQ